MYFRGYLEGNFLEAKYEHQKVPYFVLFQILYLPLDNATTS